MSNRFHSKYHRQNHHTYNSPVNPDAGHDPIASHDNPFKGDFVLAGALSAIVPSTSAYSATFQGAPVGIGTDSPNSSLSVVGNISSTGNVTLDGNGYVGTDLTVNNDAYILGNLTVYNNLSVLGDYTEIDTYVEVTSAITITNIGTGPALTVTQTGNESVASFYDDTNIALFIDGSNDRPGHIGIGTDEPYQPLTVSGNISSSDTIYTQHDIVSIDSTIGSNTATSDNLQLPLNVIGNSKQYVYEQIQNFYNGVSSSTDIILNNDTPTNYLDIGINSSSFNGNLYNTNFNITGPNDSYIYNLSGNLVMGTSSVNLGDIVLFTGGTTTSNERLRIKSTGNVGIGTSTPNRTLTVLGNVSGYNEAFFGGANATSNIRLIPMTGTSSGSSVMIRNDGNQTYFLLTSGTDANFPWTTQRPFFINNATGDIGTLQKFSIGYGAGLTPPAPLTVSGNISSNSSIISNTTITAPNIFASVGAGNGIAWTDRTGSGFSNSFYRNAGVSYFYDNTPTAPNSGNLVAITSAGNVGIGTSTPNRTLTVNGELSAANIATFNDANNYSFVRIGPNSNAGYAITRESTDSSFNIWAGGVQGIPVTRAISISSNQISPAGIANVGINTVTPNQQLTVNGAISSNNLVYATGFTTPIQAIQLTDASAITNTVLTDTGLIISFPTTGVYSIDGLVLITSASTNTINFNLNFSGSSTTPTSIMETWGRTDATFTVARATYSTFTANNINNQLQTTPVAGGVYTYNINGLINVTTAGILKVQLATVTTASGLTVRGGSYLRATRIS